MFEDQLIFFCSILQVSLFPWISCLSWQERGGEKDNVTYNGRNQSDLLLFLQRKKDEEWIICFDSFEMSSYLPSLSPSHLSLWEFFSLLFVQSFPISLYRFSSFLPNWIENGSANLETSRGDQDQEEKIHVSRIDSVSKTVTWEENWTPSLA